MKVVINKEEYKQTIINKNLQLTFNKIDQEYKNTQSIITYVCREHGELYRKAIYLYEGRGCSVCASKNARRKATETKTFTTEDFKRKSIELHGTKYDYSKAIYITAMNKLTIICPHHGEFEQTAIDHMTNGHGCKKCGRISTAKNSYLNSFVAKFTTLYYIKCYGKNEIFYKIGVAKNGVFDRYSTPESMPYLFEVLREIRGNAERLLQIEESIKLTIQLYTPLISFGGSATECTKEPIDLDMYLINT